MNIVIGVIAGALAVLGVCQHIIIVRDREARHQMGHDELTDVCKWEHLLQKAESLYRIDKPRYIIYSDIAEFKLINELFGRETGNRILQKQAEQMKRYASEGCVYGRLGEDHFIFIVEQDKFSEDILHTCRQELQKQLSDSVYNIQVYYGIYPVEHFREPLASMCDKASLAVDAIKGDRQQFISYYNEQMLEQALSCKTVLDEFEAALKSGEFQIYLQPQIEVNSGKIYGAEALVRRIKADGTLVPPGNFIPIYEKSGLISRLDLYVWEQAAKQISDWKSQGVDMRISVNISPRDFYYFEIHKIFADLVKRYDISPEYLNIEITETTIMSDVPNVRQEIQKLQQSGFIVEMDDFGSGYSSLNTLKDIDVDILKVDMGFIRETSNGEKAKIILDAIVKMAKKLQMPVITEGVETAQQVDILTKMGCDMFQGYYFSKPISVAAFEDAYLKPKRKTVSV